jgi:hypothetical protein
MSDLRFKIVDDFDLITSDNPVIIDDLQRRNIVPFDLFSPNNTIQLPLNSKYYLFIFPNTEKANINQIYRGDRDKWFALTLNYLIEKKSNSYLIGYPNGSISKHFLEQKKHDTHTDENLNEVNQFKSKVLIMQELLSIIETTGSIYDVEVIKKVKSIHKDSNIYQEPLFRNIIEELESKGCLK